LQRTRIPMRARHSERKLAGGHAPCSAAFAGHWMDEEGTIVAIEDATMRGPDGTLDVTEESCSCCSVHVGSDVFRAHATPDGRLVWSDGGMWLRVAQGSRPGCEAAAAIGAGSQLQASCFPPTAKAKKTDQAGQKQLETLSDDTRLVVLEELLERYQDRAFQKKLHEAWDRAGGDGAKQERARRNLCWRAYTPVMKKHKLLASCLDLLQGRGCSAEEGAESPREEELRRAVRWNLDPDMQLAGRLRPAAEAASHEPRETAGRARPAALPPALPARFLGGLSGELLCTSHVASSDLVRDVKAKVGPICGIPMQQQRLLLGQRLLHDFETVRDVVSELRASVPSESDPVDFLVVRIDPARASLLEGLEQGREELRELPEECRDDAETVLAAARWRVGALELATERLRGQRAFILTAIREQVSALQYASEELRSDPALVLTAVGLDTSALGFAGQKLRSDPAVVLAAVKRDGLALQFASWEVRAQEDVVLAAVRSNGGALQFADVTVVGNSDIVAAAIRQDRSAIRYADDDLKSDPSFWPMMDSVGLFEDPEMEALLWTTPRDAAELSRRGRVVLADARFPAAFRLGHVAGAFSLPGGRSTMEFGDIEETQAFSLLVKHADRTLVVYSDDGSDLALCAYLARRFRTHPRIQSHRVLRLVGGLNLWTESGLPVESGP